jgi:thymidylate synthase
MIQYLDLLRHVLEHGKFKADRTGTGTYSVFGAQARFAARRFSRCSPRKSCTQVHHLRAALVFARRHERQIPQRARRDHLGRMGGPGRQPGPRLWRAMVRLAHADGRSLNQIDEVIAQIKKNPDSRRHIVSAWNPGEWTGWRCRRATRCSSFT